MEGGGVGNDVGQKKRDGVMEEWTHATVGFVNEVVAGQSPKGSNYNSCGEGLPFYQGKKEFGDKYIGAPKKWTTQITREARSGDILMSVRAPVGPINFSTERICVGRGLAAIRAGEQTNRNFLFYSLLSMQDQIQGNEGAVFASINKKQIESLPFSFPPLPEQKRIVAILDEAFAAIATAIANAEKNLANVREVFESYLDKLLGSTDAQWVRVEKACDSIIDCVNKTAPQVDYETPYKMIRTTNVRNGVVTLDVVRFVTEETYRLWTRRQVPKSDDVILTREAPMGEVGMLESDEGVFLGQRLVSYRANPEKLLPKFLLYTLQSSSLQEQIRALGSGSTVQHMRVPDSKRLWIPMPSLSEQSSCVDALMAVKSRSQQLQETYRDKTVSLSQLKQSILHKAFTGELIANPKAADHTLSEAGL